MKCPICSNIIISSIQCKYCSIIFCSLTCLEIHHLNYHNNNNSNFYFHNNKKINSPFLVKGKINSEIIYDSTYSLKYFLPVYEQDGRIKIIGSGAYGQVYLGLNTITKKYYAIKHMDKKNIYDLLHSLSGIEKEIEIQSKIDHPNIVKLLYVKETDISYDLIMEYAPGGNLFHFIRKNKGLDETKSFSLFIQIVNAIYFLHENDLIHRDIKPENILIFENNVVKLCDFGWCVKLNGQQRETFCGTTEYMSPELVNRSGYGKEIDIWSLGVLLYEMIHGYSPFRPNKPNFNEKDVMDNIINHNLIFGKAISKECKKLIYGLLDPNINNRYKVEDIYNSEFVKKYELIQYGFQQNNKNEVSSQNQINNILYSPKFEMNNNINIHMSMDMKNYVYNIQIPEKESTNVYNINNGLRVRNQSFPKVNKGIYSNYINSSNNYGNLYNNNIINNNYYINGNINQNMSSNSSNMNNLVNINSILNNTPKQNKLINSKTLVNFYPLSLGKDREQELIDTYSYYNNEIIKDDYKRDNKDFINFNDTILYLSGKRNNINNEYKNFNRNDINNQITGEKRPQAIKNLGLINKENEKIISNLSYENSNFENNNKSYIFNYSNNFNNISTINDYPNINHFPSIHSSLIKRPNLIHPNNIILPINLANSYNQNSYPDKNISMSSIQSYSTKNNFLENDKMVNESINNNVNLISKSSILYSTDSKINEFDIEDYNNIKESEEIMIEINPSNDFINLDNKKILSKSENFYQVNSQIMNVKEKEPIDNFIGKMKMKEKEEKIKDINLSVNTNYNRNNDAKLLNAKSVELINFKKNPNIGKSKYHNKDKKENKKIKKDNENKITTSLLKKNINIEHPKEFIIKATELNKNYPLTKSRSYCHKEKSHKIKSKRQHKDSYLNYRKNLTSDKKNTKNKRILDKYSYEQNINCSQNLKTGNEIIKNKELIKSEDITKNYIKSGIDSNLPDISISSINVIYSKRENEDLKINKELSRLNLKNVNHSLLNKVNNQDLVSSSNRSIKKPKNNKKNYKIPHNNKIKIPKNKKKENNNLIGLTPISKSYLKITDMNTNKNVKKSGPPSSNKSNKPNNNIQKCLKISKTAEEKNMTKKNRVDLSNNINNNYSNNKQILNLNKIEKPTKLKPIPSLKIINEKEKIKINSINVNISKIKYNDKIKQRDISNDIKNKRKINDKKNDLYFKQTESIIINNTSEFNDTNDERNRTPKKKSIFNKIKPNKLLEAFKKELAEKSKNEYFLKIKNV